MLIAFARQQSPSRQRGFEMQTAEMPREIRAFCSWSGGVTVVKFSTNKIPGLRRVFILLLAVFELFAGVLRFSSLLLFFFFFTFLGFTRIKSVCPVGEARNFHARFNVGYSDERFRL